MKKSYSNIPEFSDVQSEEIFLQIGETSRDVDQGIANQSKYLSNLMYNMYIIPFIFLLNCLSFIICLSSRLHI